MEKIVTTKPLKVRATVIVISKDRKALILQRPPNQPFGMMWTVAGGKLNDIDGVLIEDLVKYYPAEMCAVRELEEETGIKVEAGDLKYLCSITTSEKIILSYYVVLDEEAEFIDVSIPLGEIFAYTWVEEKRLDDYDFIIDIRSEIKDVMEKLK